MHLLDEDLEDLSARQARVPALAIPFGLVGAAAGWLTGCALSYLDDYEVMHTEESTITVDEDGDAHEDLVLTTTSTLYGEVLLLDSETHEVWWRGSHTEDEVDTSSYYDLTVWDFPSFPDPTSPSALTDELMEAVVRNWPDVEG